MRACAARGKAIGLSVVCQHKIGKSQHLSKSRVTQVYISFCGDVNVFFSPNRLHHASISQLSGAELSVKSQGFFKFIGLDTANKERLTSTESVHQRVQGTLELETQGGRLFTSLCCLK